MVEAARLAAHARWQDMTDQDFDQLQQDAYWCLCEDAEQAPRHLITIVLLEQLAALRADLRSGSLDTGEVERAIRSDFARGYLAGLVGSLGAASDPGPEPLDPAMAWRQVRRLCFGHAEAERPTPFRPGQEFARGERTARADLRGYHAWLLGHGHGDSLGLRDGILDMLEADAAPLPCLLQ